jgi:methyl-accepting chemotaxis protein
VIELERNLLKTFTERHQEKINQTIDEQKQAEVTNLQAHITFIAEIINGIIQTHFFKADRDTTKRNLRPFVLKGQEIAAIRVLDIDGNPFCAVWKFADFIIDGDDFQGDIGLDENRSVEIDVLYQPVYAAPEKKIGRIQIYYSDQSLIAKIEAIKARALVETERFALDSRSQLDESIARQSIGLLVILLALVSCLIIFLRVLIFKPLLNVSTIAHQLSNFDLTVNVDTKRKDEIGKLLTAGDVGY